MLQQYLKQVSVRFLDISDLKSWAFIVYLQLKCPIMPETLLHLKLPH